MFRTKQIPGHVFETAGTIQCVRLKYFDSFMAVPVYPFVLVAVASTLAFVQSFSLPHATVSAVSASPSDLHSWMRAASDAAGAGQHQLFERCRCRERDLVFHL
jgi:hypothetical protein